VLGERRDADADRQLAGQVRARLLNVAAQPLGGQVGALLVSVGQEDRELLAADARAGVALAGRRADRLADAAQHAVALLVSPRVVQVLEAVQVADQQAQALALAARSRELHREPVVEAAAVEEPGQGVGASGLAHVGDQVGVALLEHADHRAGDDEGARRHDPAQHVGARRVVEQPEDDPVGQEDERDLAGRLPGGEELERVDRDPEVEDRVGRGVLAGAVDRPLDQDRSARQEQLERPGGGPAAAHCEQGGHQEPGDRGGQRPARVLGAHREQRDDQQRAADGEHHRQRLRAQPCVRALERFLVHSRAIGR
jgi:hypothetical protein